MMEEQKNYKNGSLLSAALLCVVCALLSKLPIGSLFFTVPFLFKSEVHDKKGNINSLLLFTMGLVVAMALFDYRGYLNKENLGMILFSLYFPVVSIIGSMVWINLKDFSDSVLRKLVICSYPVAFIGLVYSICMTLPGSEALVDGIRQAVMIMFDTVPLGIDTELFSNVFFTIMLLMIVPLGIIISVLPILISTIAVNGSKKDWKRNFASMKMPDYFIWIFMGLWIVVILSVAIELPRWLAILSWNVALGLSLHYYIGGFSVVFAVLLKRDEKVSLKKLFTWICIGSILPGINIVVVLGLVLTGALETWIKMR